MRANRSAVGIVLIMSFFMIACAIAAGIIIAVNMIPRNSNLEHAMSTCVYGSAMFYVGRNIDPEEAHTMAVSDCQSYLATNGEKWVIESYGYDAVYP